MDIALWISAALGVGFLLLCFPLLGFMPEMKGGQVQLDPTGALNKSQSPDPLNSLSSTIHASEESDDEPSFKGDPSIAQMLLQPNVLLAIPAFLVGTLRPVTLNVLIRYTSVRFGWKLSKTTFLVSEVAIINIILFLGILPLLVTFLRRNFSVTSPRIDISVARVSLMLLTIGALVIGLATSDRVVVVGK